MKKGLKKITTLGILLIIGLFSTGCGSQPAVDGDELINAAKEDYVSLDSAKVVMTNMETNEIEQTFIFKYDEKDILTYSYTGKSDKSEYAQYNNGVESFTYENGDVKTQKRGDKDFASYNRDATHPQADSGLILFVPKAVKNAEVTVENDITHVKHIYDIEKISATAEEGDVTGFSAEYFFDKDGTLLYMLENTDTDVDGKPKNVSYKIEITQKNSVENIENPVLPYINEKKADSDSSDDK